MLHFSLMLYLLIWSLSFWKGQAYRVLQYWPSMWALLSSVHTSWSPFSFSWIVVVASQCLESAYGISIRDVEAAAMLRLPSSLPEIFSAGLMQMVCLTDNFFLLYYRGCTQAHRGKVIRSREVKWNEVVKWIKVYKYSHMS